MATIWYYVLEGERQGPVEKSQIEELMVNGVLGTSDFVWKKGLENWITIEQCEDFNSSTEQSMPEEVMSIPGPIQSSFDLSKLSASDKIIYIKVGADRGANEVEYGPFTTETIKKLYSENRINAKTFIFAKGIPSWTVLADVKGFEELFNEQPPVIDDKDKRAFKRKPLIARMFIQNNNSVYEGICRDLSIGGMQVLIDNFPAKVNEKISINVHPENLDHHFVASGEVVRVLDGGHGFSFRFIDLNKEAINSINAYIG